MKEKTLGKRIAELRKYKDWTQADLAERLMVSDKAVSKWESDKGMPSIEFLAPLSKELGCTIDYLLLGKKEETFLTDITVKIGCKDNAPVYEDLIKLINLFVSSKDNYYKTYFHSLIFDIVKMNDVKVFVVDSDDSFGDCKNNVNIGFCNNENEYESFLSAIKIEMQSRYQKMMDARVTWFRGLYLSLKMQNRTNEMLPYLVLIIGNYETLISKCKHAEDYIQMLIHLGRGAGIITIVGSHQSEIVDKKIHSVATVIDFNNEQDNQFQINKIFENKNILLNKF